MQKSKTYALRKMMRNTSRSTSKKAKSQCNKCLLKMQQIKNHKIKLRRVPLMLAQMFKRSNCMIAQRHIIKLSNDNGQGYSARNI